MDTLILIIGAFVGMLLAVGIIVIIAVVSTNAKQKRRAKEYAEEREATKRKMEMAKQRKESNMQ